jgi:hypothetical protein
MRLVDNACASIQLNRPRFGIEREPIFEPQPFNARTHARLRCIPCKQSSLLLTHRWGCTKPGNNTRLRVADLDRLERLIPIARDKRATPYICHEDGNNCDDGNGDQGFPPFR